MRVKVVATAHLGRFNEGREYLSRLLELQPGLTVAKFIAYATRFISPELTALYAEVFRKGLIRHAMERRRRNGLPVFS
jgi:hypothetical protein